MGGKSGGGKVQVTQYSMSIHFGLSAKIDALRGLSYGQKSIWTGRLDTNGVLGINLPNLFGGDKKEGGVAGRVHVLLGGSTQTLADELAYRLGRPSGADCPAFRGLTTLFFTGFAPAVIASSSGSLGVAGSTGGGGSTGAINTPIRNSPMWSWLFPQGSGGGGFVWTSNTPYLRDVWATVERFPQQLDGTTAKVPRVLQFTRISYYFCLDDSDSMAGTRLSTMKSAMSAALDVIAGQVNGGADIDIGVNAWNTTSNTIEFTHATAANIETIRNWINALGTSFGTDFTAGIRPAVTWFNNSLSDPTIQRRVNIFCTDGAPVPTTTSDDAAAMAADMLDRDSGSFSSNYKTAVDMYGINIVETTTIYTAKLDNMSGGNIPVVSGDDPSGLVNAILGSINTSEYDANPAHIIYECLTDTEWGMGESPDNIDVTSFQSVANRLYGEGFGLSMMWSAESTIEDFVNEVLGHINGVLYTNPRNGKFTLKLSRGDYDVDTLRVITPDHAQMDSFTRKAWGETINEVKVSWTNPDNEQEETITLQDDGNIAMQGAVVSNSTNYYGIRSAALAAKVCARDLRSASAPLCAAEMTMDRSAWDLTPMDVVKVTWPEYGLNELVMRVTGVDYGTIDDGLITATLLEDIFTLPTMAFTPPDGSSWQNPTFPPSVTANARIIPAPYFGLDAAVETDVSGVEDPDSYVTVLAAGPTPGALSYDLATETNGPNGDPTWDTVDFARPYLGYGFLEADLKEEPISYFPGLTNVTSRALPALNDLIIFGGPDTPVDELEFALIGQTDTDRDRFVIWRGVFDTVPGAWPAGTPVWYGSAEALLADPTKRLAAATAKYRLLTNTTLGQLSIDAAPDLTGTVLARPSKPIRPADVRAQGVRGEATVDTAAHPSILLSWATRNRLTEDSQVLKWLDASVPPETGATTSIDVADRISGLALGPVSGLAGSTYALDLSMYFTEAVTGLPNRTGIRLTFRGVRDGETSWSAAFVDVWRGLNIACANSGAESGSTVGWTITGPGSVAASTAQAHSGTRSFLGSRVSNTNAVWMTQDVDVPTSVQGDADSTMLLATPLAWVYNYLRAGLGNYIDLGVSVIDADGTWRGGRMVSLDDYANRWQAAVAPLPVPFEARTLRIAARLRVRTTDNPSYVDDFEPSVRRTNATCYDLFAHADPADAGWTGTGATLGSATSTDDAGWGLPALTAIINAASGSATFSRDVAIQDGALPGVDAGEATLRYSAAMSTVATAAGRIKVEFLDAVSAILSTSYSRGEIGPSTLGETEFEAIEAAIPAGSRVVRLSGELTISAPSVDVAARFNWITAQLLDASGNQYVDRNIRTTEDDDQRVTEDGELRIIDVGVGENVAWTPAHLSVPADIWLDETSPAINDGTGACSRWGETGACFDQTFSATYRPMITESGLNGLRVLTFDGSNDWMDGASFAATTNNATKNSSFLVANPTVATGTKRLLNFSIGPASTYNSSARANIGLGAGTFTAIQRRLDTDTAATASIAHASKAWRIHNAENDWLGQKVSIRLDGGTPVVTTTTQGSGATSPTDSDRVELGGTADAGGQCCETSVAEVIKLGYLPTDDERQKIEGYLAWKWGLQGNLPAGHPYKSARPTV